MTHYYYYAIALYFLIAPSCYAMEQSKQLLKKSSLALTILPLINFMSPDSVEFLTNDHIIRNTPKECTILDLSTQNIVTTIQHKHHCPHISCAINPNKTQFSLTNCKSCAIYDATTYEELQNITNKMRHIMQLSFFTATDDSIIIKHTNGQFVQHFYEDITRKYYHFALIKETSPMALHPKKKEFCFVDLAGKIMIHSTENQNHSLRKTLDLNIKLLPESCQYSHNGNFIIVQYPNNLYIVKSPDYSNNPDYSFKSIYIKHLFKSVIHPNNAIIATILMANGCLKKIQYRDAQTTKIIGKQRIPKCFAPTDFNKRHPHLACSMSPDGKKILIAFADICVIFPVPFEMIYQTDTKKIVRHLLFLLNNYQHGENGDPLPKDITYYLMKILLQSCKR